MPLKSEKVSRNRKTMQLGEHLQYHLKILTCWCFMSYQLHYHVGILTCLLLLYVMMISKPVNTTQAYTVNYDENMTEKIIDGPTFTNTESNLMVVGNPQHNTSATCI